MAMPSATAKMTARPVSGLKVQRSLKDGNKNQAALTVLFSDSQLVVPHELEMLVQLMCSSPEAVCVDGRGDQKLRRHG